MPRIEVQALPQADDRSLPIFAELDALYREIREQAYRRFEQRGSAGTHELEDWFGAERELWPATELAEDDQRYEVKMALAGFAPGDVQLTATPHAIIVKASRSASGERHGGNVHWSEFRHDDVCRYVPLPGEVDIGKVKAAVKHGLLTVTAPKATDRRAKKPRSPQAAPGNKAAAKRSGKMPSRRGK